MPSVHISRLEGSRSSLSANVRRCETTSSNGRSRLAVACVLNVLPPSNVSVNAGKNKTRLLFAINNLS